MSRPLECTNKNDNDRITSPLCIIDSVCIRLVSMWTAVMTVTLQHVRYMYLHLRRAPYHREARAVTALLYLPKFLILP